MINIKNNKLLSTNPLVTKLLAKKVPFFINPNRIAADVAPLEIYSDACCSFTSSGAPLAAAGQQLMLELAKKEEVVAAARGKNQPLVLAQLVQPKPKLVFLQKKGSQIPNPSIISYNFPGTSGQLMQALPLVANATVIAASQLLNAAAATSCSYKNNTVVAGLPSNEAITNKLAPNNVYKLLFNFFKSMYCLISKPVFITTPDKIKIQLFYFLCIPKFLINRTVIAAAASNSLIKSELSFKGTGQDKPSQALGFNSKDLNVKVNLKRLTQSNLTEVYPQKFKLICTILSKFFNKNVELELIRLHQPYYNSNILVNFLALIINKKNIGACIQRLYNSNIIKANKASAQDASIDASAVLAASQLSGLNIKISGRLMREPIIPRITTKKFEKGFTAKGKINYLDLARFTHKNRKGAFTITVKSGQNF